MSPVLPIRMAEHIIIAHIIKRGSCTAEANRIVDIMYVGFMVLFW